MGIWSSYVDWVGANIWGYDDQAKLCQKNGENEDYDDLCIDVSSPPTQSTEFNEWLGNGLTMLEGLVKSKQKKPVVAHSEPREHIYFCFPGSAYLQKRNGGLISFRELSILANDGRELPEVASFDEGTSSVVYQRPVKVISHGVQDSTLLYLGLEDDISMVPPLMVTENHELLVNRDEEQVWVPAGELRTGDELVGPEGSYYYEDSATIAIQGAFDLFDLSFSTPDRRLKPTFLVSPDGTNWFVAHNKTY